MGIPYKLCILFASALSRDNARYGRAILQIMQDMEFRCVEIHKDNRVINYKHLSPYHALLLDNALKIKMYFYSNMH